MTPRAPLGLTRPLTATIGAPGAPPPAARRRGAALSWRRAAKTVVPSAVHAQRDVHHHWPLTVTLLFGPASAQPGVSPSPTDRSEAPLAAPRGATTRAVMLWEKRRPRETGRDAPDGRATTRAAMLATSQPSPSAPAGRAGSAAPGQPAFARTLHALVEQRWLRTRTTRFLPAEVSDIAAPRARPAGRPSAMLRYAPGPEAAVANRAYGRRRAARLSTPMRAAEQALFAGDPLVRRSLRRISVTPSQLDRVPIAATPSAARRAGLMRARADTTPAPTRITRARPAEQFWPDQRTGGGTSFAQPFAPTFSSPAAATPAIAYAPTPAPVPAAAPAPDVNKLVDEVMRRIERQTRQDRVRRGL